ncbi:hypothetical protein ABZ801_22745 [Actinomadura sp. NPDC047616]|uniref:hypothetical protein n=1 Tax=Actinomadura sp. NPDC047616 TaxID=3155914 RepID=UPI0033E77A49
MRAVPGGWVSGALVRRTRVGDTLLLGPARGTLTLDPGCDRDLLPAAGGSARHGCSVMSWGGGP